MENKTIKNNVTMFVFAVLSLVVMLGAAVVGTKIFTEAYALVGSAVLVAIAVVMHLLGSKLKINVFYSISLMLNAVAGGFGACAFVCIAALTIITEGDVGSEFFDGFVPEKKAKTKK